MEDKSQEFFQSLDNFLKTVINPQLKAFADQSVKTYGADLVNRFMVQTDVYELIPMDQVTTEELQGDKKVN